MNFSTLCIECLLKLIAYISAVRRVNHCVGHHQACKWQRKWYRKGFCCIAAWVISSGLIDSLSYTHKERYASRWESFSEQRGTSHMIYRIYECGHFRVQVSPWINLSNHLRNHTQFEMEQNTCLSLLFHISRCVRMKVTSLLYMPIWNCFMFKEMKYRRENVLLG